MGCELEADRTVRISNVEFMARFSHHAAICMHDLMPNSTEKATHEGSKGQASKRPFLKTRRSVAK